MGILDALSRRFSKPPHLIEVARTNPTTSLGLRDLSITHPACGGGKLEPDPSDKWLKCQRCHVTIFLYEGEGSIGAIFHTAFDGKGRWVQSHHIPEAYSGVFVQELKS